MNVPFVIVRFVPLKFVANRFVAVAFCVTKNVLVAFVVVPARTESRVIEDEAFDTNPEVKVPKPVSASVPVAVTLPPRYESPPTTKRASVGDDEPTPTLPFERTVNTRVLPLKRLRRSPAPFWIMVRSVEAVVVASVVGASERRYCVDDAPPRFFASNAAGTAPSIFLGDISPSQTGEPVPPISTPRYSVWLKSTPVNGVVDPSMIEKRPFVTWTFAVPVSDSVQTADVVAWTCDWRSQKRMLYVPSATATLDALVSLPW